MICWDLWAPNAAVLCRWQRTMVLQREAAHTQTETHTCKHTDETVTVHIVPSCFLTGVSREDQSARSTEAVSRHMLYIKNGCVWEASLKHFKAPIRATCSSEGCHHCTHMELYNVQPPPRICTRVCTCMAGGVPFEDQTGVVLPRSRRVNNVRKGADDGVSVPDD